MKKTIEKYILCDSCGEIKDAEMISQKQFIKECGKETLKVLLEDSYYEGDKNDYEYKPTPKN